MADVAETAPLLNSSDETCIVQKSPKDPRTVTALIQRIQALTLELLPIQVELEDLCSPTSSIITKELVAAYTKIGGSSFSAAVPFALLQARKKFKYESQVNPADADENKARAMACEALARKIVSKLELKEQYHILSARFTYIDHDGDVTLPLSVIESAVDQRASFFLSSSESQRCVFALWRGALVQVASEESETMISYKPYKPHSRSFLGCWNVQRLAVPRYQYVFRLLLWIVFLVAFTIAIQTPERGFGVEDWILYVQLLGYIIEDVVRGYKIYSIAALGFWQWVNLCIYILATIGFVYRVADVATSDPDLSMKYRILSFQFLSSAAPFIWMKLLPVFDVFSYFGTMQIVCRRMMAESAVFFTLLALLAVGFGQSLTGLDIADNSRDSTEKVIHSLIQGLLGSPVFDLYESGTGSYPFGMVLYYTWSGLTLIILLNILVALFNSAYEDATNDAASSFLSFFAEKTISSIRAPDQFVYVAPSNIIEVFILPLEFILPKKTYGHLNKSIMSVVFFLPLSAIALYESHFESQNAYLALLEEPDEFSESHEDPETPKAEGQFPGEEEGAEITEVKFSELKKALPSLTRSPEAEILYQLSLLMKKVESLEAEIKELKEKK